MMMMMMMMIVTMQTTIQMVRRRRKRKIMAAMIVMKTYYHFEHKHILHKNFVQRLSNSKTHSAEKEKTTALSKINAFNYSISQHHEQQQYCKGTQ